MKQKQSEEDLTLIFITLDNNGDGYIKINEFIKWLDL
jgi:Ca2+-binding EF-hand superfamily protein